VTAATSESAYEYDIAAADVDGDVLSITASTDLPEWLSLTDNGDGTATLSGTPTNSDAGSLDVTLHVTDGTDSADQSFTVDIAAINHAPGMAPTSDGSVIAGVAFQQTVDATD